MYSWLSARILFVLCVYLKKYRKRQKHNYPLIYRETRPMIVRTAEPFRPTLVPTRVCVYMLSNKCLTVICFMCFLGKSLYGSLAYRDTPIVQQVESWCPTVAGMYWQIITSISAFGESLPSAMAVDLSLKIHSKRFLYTMTTPIWGIFRRHPTDL